MIRVENIKTYNIVNAIYSARNPMNSWNKSDSDADREILGEKDLDLAKKLFKAGTEHRKYLRQIFVSMDITAPLYWWKQIDQYKVGTVTNSCSTMHKLMAKEFESSDFSFEHVPSEAVDDIVFDLNDIRETYLNFDKLAAEGRVTEGYSKKDVWYCLVQMLPSSYNQKRTLTMDYENVFTIIRQRTGHKLDEWNKFIEILKTLPYVREIGGLDEKGS